MDKIFTPNRYFVGFCAVLILAVFAANYIRDQRILEQAKLIGRQEAEWTWPSQGVSTNVGEIKAKILKQTENDATVEVHGEQSITATGPILNPSSNSTSNPGSNPAANSNSDFKAVLTLYKNGNSRIWLLGKVEGQ
jgi:hypothetical protein